MHACAVTCLHAQMPQHYAALQAAGSRPPAPKYFAWERRVNATFERAIAAAKAANRQLEASLEAQAETEAQVDLCLCVYVCACLNAIMHIHAHTRAHKVTHNCIVAGLRARARTPQNDGVGVWLDDRTRSDRAFG